MRKFILLAIAINIVFLVVFSLQTRPKKITTEIPSLFTITSGLEVPWSLVLLPDGRLLVTERPGRVRIIEKDNSLRKKPLLKISVVQKVQGEGGLHGIALSPNFNDNNFVYLYYTYETNGNRSLNRVVRYVFTEDALVENKVIVDKIPGALFHDGGRIKFGPDNLLYITTGDAQDPSLAQDKNALAGKILRVTDDGKPAPNNPFGTAIYSYGHRNPQGIAWDEKGQLWETEHGQSAEDEVNRIEAGKNYGWPIITGEEKQNGMVSPILQSGSETWAPAGMAYIDGFIYFVGLRGQALYRVNFSVKPLRIETFFKGEFGRLRDIIVGPDKMLYITTSNRDGRGLPKSGDDKIIRVNPQKL